MKPNQRSLKVVIEVLIPGVKKLPDQAIMIAISEMNKWRPVNMEKAYAQ